MKTKILMILPLLATMAACEDLHLGAYLVYSRPVISVNSRAMMAGAMDYSTNTSRDSIRTRSIYSAGRKETT